MSISADGRKRVVFAYRFGLLGGVSAQLLNRFPSFSERYDVSILFEFDYGMVARFPPGVARVTKSADEKVEAIRELDPDIFLVIDSPLFLPAWHDAGAPGRLMVEVHTTTRNVAYLEELTSDQGISAFITVSDYMAQSLRTDGLDAIAPIFIVSNCLDERWFRDPAIQELPERPLLWVGKLDTHKRWRAALDVMDDVHGRLHDASVQPVIVGGYTAPAAEIKAFLKRLYASPALRDGYWWPQVDYGHMPTLYRSSARAGGGLLLTTRNESFGMAPAEALLMGCPVIAPAVGALPELLPEQALYDPEDWEAAAAKTTQMLEDPEFRQSLLQTQDRVREIVRPETAVEAFETAIANGASGA
ncbi:MAG: hypothetical protein QOJ29_3930 [Thermoleophilaceae bacterium]|nr:hypothetical protein [Thermoleophilaceae bacterium]